VTPESKGDQYSFLPTNNCSDQIFQDLHLLPNFDGLYGRVMQINLDSAAVARRVMTVPSPRISKFGQAVLSRPAPRARYEIGSLGALENLTWAVIALSAVWGLGISLVF